MKTVLRAILSSKFFSPTVFVLVVGGAALNLAYEHFRTAVALAILLLVQAVLGVWRRVKGRYSWKLSLARISSVLLLAPIIYLDSYQMVWERRIRFTLKGDLPSHISDLQTYEDIWTDYVITMRFKADPASVKRILTNGKFASATFQEGADKGYIYAPVSGPKDVLHRITVSDDYTKVFIEYAAD